MTANEGSSGVSNCYVFKSRLQEYAQKVGLPTPVYETIKEGPSHEPSFRSTVIVNDVRYDSLPGFFNRKAAEQSAAEVALVELAKSSGDNKECISVPVHETGLCKNLLQEYAQKMNYAIPLYECQRDDTPGRMTLFTCTVEIGGMRYIGGAARNKKEAEIKAARTALLAIQSSSSGSTGLLGGDSQLTVLPGKKREIESVKKSVETPSALKPKKARCKKKKKMATHRPNGEAIGNLFAESARISGSDITGLVALAMNQTVHSGIQVTRTLQQLGTESVMNPEIEVTDVNPNGDVSAVELDAQLGMESLMKPEVEVSNVNPGDSKAWKCPLIPHSNGELKPLNGQSLDDQNNPENPNGQAPDLSNSAIHEDTNSAGEMALGDTVKSNEDQSNNGKLNGQTPPMPCEDLSNSAIHEDAKNAEADMER